MIFSYKAIDKAAGDTRKEGTIDAVNMDVAISSLQKRNLLVLSIDPIEDSKPFWENMTLFSGKPKSKDIVILSRQLATLFEAQVSALRIFRLMSLEAEKPAVRKILSEVADDIQGGDTISQAMSRHPEVFSDFYVNMVRAGEESGKLDETFLFLADYLDRTYEITSKAKSAFVYPAFVVTTFIGVMILMFTVIIPKIAVMLNEAGQDIPIYTKIVLGISNGLLNYGLYILVALIIGGFFFVRYVRTPGGAYAFDQFKLSVPYVGDLYRKIYLARIADNMNTMLTSGIPMIRILEITAAVVDNKVYQAILENIIEDVRSGSTISDAASKYKEIPGIMVQMMRVGEESGELGKILKTLARFYQREVNQAVDNLVSLIEPIMIVALGAGVGILLAAVLMPIYNIASAT
ncbi:MAG: hypothetical protein COV34_00220 [Candidatus Zambryskibacteria bacterium CG10_big_fil_rev_8_21_14_0_10_42_12]|uniref:Type II secretion system protein GspF domain-containing protein n=1 Tax=Candidatus Zambryskibacteria bacterium CG10_big_fil_rev_8_21_14_0_10_42_12 TaxID=1975115 RepID=A0A2H0QX63_9BACT|nr:MAG: hypothetical protein COV34_00220 [Candidatus Zambryskibacteria bacterium CG10_big_fil_rev_8_21_14_0_10_42_12]